jgi:hypothetical protein
VKKRRKLKSQALQRPQHQALKWAVSLKRNPPKVVVTCTLPDGTKIEELNNATAAQMVPFDSIKFTGNYGNMTEISYQVAKRAAKKGAKFYHITRQWQERGNNITISADLYK